ncbi:FixH family protein [Novosphingobium mangrovi (ex Huang et al. 2023)]|uniref:FixH family protein n=1 Tax=Novosphingobium mangrovi (ex Huang et al. 2023) TaxID=2976432 RepID=A0ABT2I1D8_9SPHN|nr:FixH family protein [Novosphingobium mangrovi (ex Huang et al. 2023)]MCT2398610.1 FixH family protein [Novosphingobium mangrovi (ex Huang et al. 2023)]
MSSQNAPRRKPFTGKHMFLILLTGFGVVFGVNFLMAGLATSTFGGVVVENSYVASQHFNRWLDEAAKEKALDWKVAVSRREDGHIVALLDGVPRYPDVIAEARHPLGRKPDMALKFEKDVTGAYVSDKALPEGRWILRFEIEADGKTWRGEDQVEGLEVIGQPVP